MHPTAQSPTTSQRGANGVPCHGGRHDGHNVFLMGQMCSKWRKGQWWGFGLRLSTKLQGSTTAHTAGKSSPLSFYEALYCESFASSIAGRKRR